MAGLSISRAWDDTNRIAAHDGGLIVSVALALIALPNAILGVVSPGSVMTVMFSTIETDSFGLTAMFIAALLFMVAGQLAVTRLAIGPSVSVGEAIAHAVRRLPIYLAVGLIVGATLLLAAVVAAIVIAMALGGPAVTSMSQEELAKSPLLAAMVIPLFGLYLFLFARIISVAAAVISTERLGPIAAIRRSWLITRGHFWRLLAFVILFLVSTGIVLFAIGSVAGLLAQLLFGKVEPMSASAVVFALIEALASTAVTVLLSVMLARIYVQLAGSGDTQASVPSSGI